MNAPRFFIDGNIELGKTFELTEGPSHHLTHVLRKAIGEKVTTFSGKGGEFTCSIESIRKKTVEIKPIRYDEINRAPKLEIDLGLCILKKSSMDSVLAKITELGVSRVTPLLSENCAVAHKIIHQRMSHWRRVIIAACEQCGLNVLPALVPTTQLTDWLTGTNADLKLISLLGDYPPIKAVAEINSLSLVTGPEGGFSKAEQEKAIEAGFNAVTFGERTIRAETAPIVALSVSHQVWGDFSIKV